MVNQIQNMDLIIRQNEINSSTSMAIDWEQGEILEGKIISNEGNTAVVEIEGIQLQIKTKEKLNEIGNNIKLEVESISKDEIRLRLYEENEVRVIKQYDRIQSMLRRETIPITKQNIEIAQKMIDSGVNVEKDIFDEVIKVKKQIDKIINTMSEKEAQELLESPYDVEKISIDVITRFFSKSTNDKEKITKEDIEKELKNYIEEEQEVIERSVKVLLENNLPVTRKNVDSLIIVQEKLDAVKNMDDKSIAYFIKRNISYTLNNLYASIFSSGKEELSKEVESPYEDAGLTSITEDYELTKEEIKIILKAQRITTDDEHINAAKFLIKHNIDVDKEKVEKIITLRKQISKIDDNLILDKAVRLLKENKNPGKVEIVSDELPHTVEKPLTNEELKRLIKDIKDIDDESIRRLIRKNIPLNLKNLQQERSNKAEEKEIKENGNNEIDTRFISAKRQLEEIRLKMTLEAAKRLNQKIEIDITPLKELVEELKILEKEYYGDCLRKAGTESSKENIEQLEELYKKLEAVKELDERVLPKVIKREIKFIIDDLYKEQVNEKTTQLFRGESAFSKYEEMETKPNPRFGDAIRKIESQIEPLLKEQEIEPSKENIRCARILIQNDIEVTEENIINLKLLDEELNFVAANLHPTIAAKMIKEGFRPDQIPVDQVIDYIKEFETVLGKDVRDKLNEFILNMDEDKSLTNEEREGMIAIYRVLSTIERSNGKVIGWLMKNKMSFTLNNLMEGAKYLARTGGKRQDMDVSIDDDFGLVKELKFHEKSIKTQLEKAFREKPSDSSIEEKTRVKDDTKKIAEQLKPILKEEGIEATKENIRYAKILRQNNIEVTKENITELKRLDEKISTIRENLQPNIEEESRNINKAIDYIRKRETQRKEILGEELQEKLNEFIGQMDKEKTLTKEQRESIINIYRALNKLEISNQNKEVISPNIIEDLYKEQISEEISKQNNEEEITKNKEIEKPQEPEVKDDTRKVEEQIKPILKEEGIEATKESIRYAKVLRQNNIEVTKENITELKRLDEQISTIRENLQPSIKEESRNINKIIDYIRKTETQRKEILGEELQEKLNEFIGQMDKEKILTKEQRESIINIYRALNKLEISNQNKEVISPNIIEDLYKEQISEEISKQNNEEETITKNKEIEKPQEPEVKDDTRKVEEQIKPILKEEGIEATKESIRYAKVLRQNNIEVTKENITELKRLDEQISTIRENLQPSIKEESRNINKIIDYIRKTETQRKEILGEELQEKLNEFIDQIDKEKILTKEQRESIINIYRALNKLEISNQNKEVISPNIIEDLYKEQISEEVSKQSKEEAITKNKELERPQEPEVKDDTRKAEEQIKPILKEEGIEATKENIRYSKILRQNNIEVTKQNIIELKSLDNQISSTRESLQPSAAKEIIKTDYYERIIEDFSKLASPEKLKEWFSNNPKFLEEDLETIYTEYIKEEYIKKSFVPDALVEDTSHSSIKEEAKKFLNNLGNLKNIKQDTLIFIEKNTIPINIKNLQIVSSMMENPFIFGENLEKFNNISKELGIKDDIHKLIREEVKKLKKEKEVEEVLDELKEKVKEVKEELLNFSSEQKQSGWKTGNDIEKMIDIQKQIQKQEGIYQIPVLINNKITNMNIYLMKDRQNERQEQKEGISAFISVETEHMGNIQMYIHMDEKNVDFKISGENEEITRYLKSQKDRLKNAIENIGYKIIKGQFNEELKEVFEQNPLLTSTKKYLDSGFEIIA